MAFAGMCCTATAILVTTPIWLTGCSHLTADEKTKLVQAAQSLTDAAFTAGGPLLTDAAMALPPAAQLLVQAGYGALRKAVEVAESEGIAHAGAQDAVAQVAQAADTLHAAVHTTADAAVAQP